MIKILKSVTKYRGFRKEKLTESNEEIQNPCRGMFDLHTFSVDEDPDFSAKKSTRSREVSLVLVLIDIGAAREREINAEEIQRIDAMEFFEKIGLKSILSNQRQVGLSSIISKIEGLK